MANATKKHVKLGFESLQALVILLVAAFGWNVCVKVMSAGQEANEQWIGHSVQYSQDGTAVGLAGVETTGSPDNAVAPGDMMVKKSDAEGMSHCQLHYNVNLVLKWGKGDIVDSGNVSSIIVDIGNKGSIRAGSVSIGDEKKACPSEKSYSGDCSYLSQSVWDTQPEEGQRYYTITFFFIAAIMMVAWVAMKLISLDADLVDFVVGKLCCCCCKSGDLEGHAQAMMLNFTCLKNYGKVQFILKEFAKYFRFKIAANTMLWPLTTLGYNTKCPNHLFTQMPGLVMYYILVAVASMDLIYMLVLYCISAKKPGVKDCRILFIPFVGSTLCALLGAIMVLIKSNWSVIFGFNWNLAFTFEMTFALGMFQAFYLLLSLLEIVSLVVKIGKKAAETTPSSKADPETGTANVSGKVVGNTA